MIIIFSAAMSATQASLNSVLNMPHLILILPDIKNAVRYKNKYFHSLYLFQMDFNSFHFLIFNFLKKFETSKYF